MADDDAAAASVDAYDDPDATNPMAVAQGFRSAAAAAADGGLRSPAAVARARGGVGAPSGLKDVLFLVTIAVVAVTGLYYLTLRLPPLKADPTAFHPDDGVDAAAAAAAVRDSTSSGSGQPSGVSVTLVIPSSLADVQRMRASLTRYLRAHPVPLLVVFCYAFLLKQTFSIPGSALLNVTAGALFGVGVGFPLVCVLTALGTSCCYVLSSIFCKRLAARCCTRRLEALETAVRTRSARGDLFWYLLGLRLFPASPNWLINLASPLLGVPYPVFVASVLFGLAPYNFVCVQAGSILGSLSSLSDVWTPQLIAQFVALAAAALLPVALRGRFRARDAAAAAAGADSK